MTAIAKLEKVNGFEAVVVYKSFEVKDDLKALGFRFDGERKAWWVSVTDREALEGTYALLAATPGASTGGVEQALARDAITAPRIEASPEVTDLSGPLPLEARRLKRDFGLDLFDFQARGALWATGRRTSLIADSPGLGKTRQALAACMGDDRILIVSPSAVKTHWAREAAGGYGLTIDDVVVLKGMKPSPIDTNARVVIVNYDILAGQLPAILAWAPDALIFDEAHALKTPTSKRTKAAMRMCDELGSPRIVMLTGTPMLNRPVELWPLLQMLGVAQAFGGHYKNFTSTYCAGHYVKVAAGKQVWDVSGASNLTELSSLLYSTVMIRREKEEVLDELPERMDQFIELDLEGALAEYRKAEKALVKELRSAEHARSMQGAQSHIATMCRLAGEAKVPAALAWIHERLETVDKLVVFAHHRDVRMALMDGLADYGVVGIGGETKESERQAAIDAFQSDPNVRVFVGQTQSASVGITLTAASDVVFCEPEWTPSLMAQGADRVRRIGQTASHVTISYLVAAECATDAYQYGALQDKSAVIDTVVGSDSDTEVTRVTQTGMAAFARSLMKASKSKRAS